MAKQSRKEQIKSNLKGKGKKPGNTPLTDPLTTPQARNMAKSEARAEYGPTIRAAKADKRGSVQRQKNIGQWFEGLNNQIGEAGTQTDASYNQANAALLAHMNAAQAAAAGSQSQIAQSNQAMTALTGADPSLTTPALQEGAAAANQRNIAGAALAAPIAQAGAGQAAYLRNTGINTRREGISQKLGEAKRRDTIKQDITALRKERAGKAIGNFRDIRGEERDYGIQKAAFGLDKKTAAADAQNAAFDNSIAARNATTAERNAATTEKNAAGGNGGMSPSEQRSAQAGRQNAMAAAKQKVTEFGKPGSAQEWAELQSAIAEEEGVDPREAKWAVDRLKQKWGWKPKGNQLPVKAW